MKKEIRTFPYPAWTTFIWFFKGCCNVGFIYNPFFNWGVIAKYYPFYFKKQLKDNSKAHFTVWTEFSRTLAQKKLKWSVVQRIVLSDHHLLTQFNCWTEVIIRIILDAAFWWSISLCDIQWIAHFRRRCFTYTFINTSDSFAIPIGGERVVGVYKPLFITSKKC